MSSHTSEFITEAWMRDEDVQGAKALVQELAPGFTSAESELIGALGRLAEQIAAEGHEDYRTFIRQWLTDSDVQAEIGRNANNHPSAQRAILSAITAAFHLLDRQDKPNSDARHYEAEPFDQEEFGEDEDRDEWAA